MIETTGKELIVKFESKVIASNFEEWKAEQKAAIDAINKTPKTAEDYGQAKADVKACGEAEIKIHRVKTDLLAQSRDMMLIMDGLDELDAETSRVRLLLTKAIAAETERIKTQKINNATDAVTLACINSVVSYAVSADIGAIRGCIKGLKTEASIDNALFDEVARQTKKVNTIAAQYLVNKAAVDAAEAEAPGLFPDRKTLLLNLPEVVASEIESRVAKFKLAMKEKAEREEADIPPPPSIPEFIPPPADIIFDAPDFDAPLFDAPTPEPLEYRLIVTVRNNDLVAAMQAIRALPEVISARED